MSPHKSPDEREAKVTRNIVAQTLKKPVDAVNLKQPPASKPKGRMDHHNNVNTQEAVLHEGTHHTVDPVVATHSQ